MRRSVRQSLTVLQSGKAAKLSRRIVIISATLVTVAVFVFRRWLALLIAQVQDAAIAVFINAIEPAAPQRIVIKGVVILRVVAEYPGRAETIANQRARIFLLAGRDLIIELGQLRILIQQVSRIK